MRWRLSLVFLSALACGCARPDARLPPRLADDDTVISSDPEVDGRIFQPKASR